MTTEAKPAPYLYDLNPEQRAAVLHTEGPLLILAGAGSGKTKTLVHRIVHLIRGKEVEPSRIVVVTFTNRAADEMRERVQAYAGKEARAVTVSTFHSLGVRILRAHGARLGLPERFAVYSAPDQLAALRTACAEISIDDDRFDLKRVLRRISDWKSRRVSPEAAAREVAEARTRGGRADDYAILSAHAYGRYEEVLRAAGAVDFDDLLLLPVRLLEEDDEARRDLWRRWHYLMIDEYQDTNAVQLDMARLLAGPRRNLCVVGDDDQSIYAFRGADVGNILEFERHFPGARVITLEQNYRSTRRILAAANAVIAGNAHRHPKQLRTENAIGAPIDYYEHADEEAEAETIAKELSVRRFTQKAKWGDFAVLYRTNTQARPLEEALRAQNIPYRVIGGTSFFDRKEVADAVAYLRAVAYPDDEIAVRRIINYPTRGIGRTTVLKVAEVAQEKRVGFVEALAKADAELLGAAPARAVAEFLELLAHARAELRAAEANAAAAAPGAGLPPIARWADEFFARIGIEEAIRADKRNARSADARVDNLRDVVGAIARFERRTWAALAELEEDPAAAEEWSPPTLADALARIALADMDDRDGDDREDDASVALMTLHSAKGLEFPEVFIVGLEEEILPHARSLDDAADADAPGYGDPLAEERRLLYVGITRARQRLTLSLCRARRKNGEAVPRQPSRYLAEIPADLLNVKSAQTILSAEESAALRENFFAQMKAMLGGGEE
ncbi:MAG TPA: UvrD-helicase domain-containing protein [Longimicrobiales bacterium]